MITMWSLYLLNVLFNLAGVVLVPMFICGTFLLFAMVAKIIDEEDFQSISKFIRPALVTVVICTSILTLVPSKKEALAIYIIPKVLNNQQVQELPENALKYFNVFFKKELKEITQGLEE